MVIKGYINNPERLSEYLDEVIGEHKTGQNYTVKQLGFLPDGGVKGLLYHKLSKMEDNNIKYYLYVDQNLKDKDIEILKGLSVSLGQTDLENQIKNIRLVQQMLMTQLKDATEEKNRSYKMYRNMGVLTGLILIILLI